MTERIIGAVHYTDEQAEQGFTCPDCVAEGDRRLKPLSAFYQYSAARYAGGKRRSPYCIPHTNRRTTERLQAKLDTDSPEYDPALHERRKEAKTRYARKKLSPASPEYDPALHARQLEAKKQYKASKRSTSSTSRSAPAQAAQPGRRVRSSVLTAPEQAHDEQGHWQLMREAAERIGVSVGTIRNMQHRGLLARPLTPEIVAGLTPADKPERKHARKGELTVSEAAQLLEVSEDTVYKLKRAKVLTDALTRAEVEQLREQRAAS